MIVALVNSEKSCVAETCPRRSEDLHFRFRMHWNGVIDGREAFGNPRRLQSLLLDCELM